METVGKIPDFKDEGAEEVKKAPIEEIGEEETETPEEPSASEKPADEPQEEEISGDTDNEELQKQVQGLSQEREKLLKEIQELRGQRREIKQVELTKVESKVDELKDLHQEDVALIDRIFKAKGYASKEDVQKIWYEQIKQEKLNAFLEKYPEFKPENDSHDINWSALQRELGYYKFPTDPHRIPEILERARKAIQPVASGRNISTAERNLKTAGLGTGGVNRSSPSKSLSPEKRAWLKGFTEEEIREMESNL